MTPQLARKIAPRIMAEFHYFFVKILPPKMSSKWLPKSNPNDHKKQAKFWCENEPQMRPKNALKTTLQTTPKKTLKNQSNSGPEKKLFMSGNGKR